MQKTLLFLLLLLSAHTHAQQPYIVISNTGLNLRETPGQTGKVLATAPFGAQVQVLTEEYPQGHTGGGSPRIDNKLPVRRDTIGTLLINGLPTLHAGYWYPVRYQGKEGYMFSGFLADSATVLHHQRNELNNNFRLRMAGGNVGASNLPEFDLRWHWYGLFRQPDGMFALKKAQPRYAVLDFTGPDGVYELVPDDVVVFTGLPESPLLLIGTREPWKERSGIAGFWSVDNPLEQFRPGTSDPDPEFMKKYELEVLKKTISEIGTYPREVLEWTIRGKNGQRQLIAPLELYSGYKQAPDNLAWAGDLDGDGRLDYVFGSYGEIGYYLLYLSSLAGKGELVRPAAVLWTWYAC